MIHPRRPSTTEITPHPQAKPHRASTQPKCSLSVPGSRCTARPTAPVANHISPEVRSGSGPSS
jgi:hypothetical protein